MSRRSWKRAELRVATETGGQRVPITGRARGSAPDVAHPYLSIEVKTRKVVPDWILTAMKQAVASARGDQMPVVFIHRDGDRWDNALVCVRLQDARSWWGIGDPVDLSDSQQPVEETA